MTAVVLYCLLAQRILGVASYSMAQGQYGCLCPSSARGATKPVQRHWISEQVPA
jgi:hypothetical protein